jgi:chromosomal replication initiation ATPase DnaA
VIESRPPAVETQLSLALDREPSYDRELFVVSACNREAAAAVDGWPDWPGGALALIGPEGSGKTHLARAWAARTGAAVAGAPPLDIAQLPPGPVLLEDADRRPADMTLFHLINRAQAGASLLLTARTPPRSWVAALPDLRSRLNALPTAALGAPDDLVLRGVLLKFFRDRNIRPEPELPTYLLRRMERSVSAASAMVSRLDEAAGAARREVTRALARDLLEGRRETAELFERDLRLRGQYGTTSPPTVEDEDRR